MNKCKNYELITSSEGINYFVIQSESDNPRTFGVLAAMQDDTEDNGCTKNLFFTKEEAQKCCMWLAENQVYPITLSEVMENFYRF